MAKPKKEKEKKEDKKSVKKTKKNGLSAKGRLVLVGIVLVGIVFLPTSLLLFIGMLPTIAAFFLSVRRTKARVSTIAAMNFSGCVPFVFKLWSGENDFAYSLGIVTQPITIIIIFGAAILGYLIDWVVVGVVSSFMYQRAEARLGAIKDRQAELIAEWGQEVTGKAV